MTFAICQATAAPECFPSETLQQQHMKEKMRSLLTRKGKDKELLGEKEKKKKSNYRKRLGLLIGQEFF